MKRVVLSVSVIGVAAAITAGFLVRGRSTDATSYRLVSVQRGDIEATVNATGTLGAVRTVQVGTQVSGQISELYADFNSHVRQGQLIARLDPTLLNQAVSQAQSDVEKAQASVEQTRFLAEQATRLHDAASMTDTDYRTAVYNAQVAQTGLRSAQVSLERAQQNLRYATIRSPIDGIVIERDVDVGQTVAASLQAPQLFLIAEDLRHMQILASVDESDIGQIRNGLSASFTVQAYPNRTFHGTVQQVRLASKTTENVVNYTVVVAVDNPDGALLPSMTATVTFEVSKETGVLKVANAALRFRPPEAVAAQAGGAVTGDSGRQRTAAGAVPRTGAGAPSGAGATGATGAAGAAGSAARRSAGQRQAVGRLWYVGTDGKPVMMRVQTGLSDGQFTAVSGPELREGMQVIAGALTGKAEATAATSTTNPFQATQRSGGGAGGPPRPPGGF
jgi:HlyD family secretion protein